MHPPKDDQHTAAAHTLLLHSHTHKSLTKAHLAKPRRDSHTVCRSCLRKANKIVPPQEDRARAPAPLAAHDAAANGSCHTLWSVSRRRRTRDTIIARSGTVHATTDAGSWLFGSTMLT